MVEQNIEQTDVSSEVLTKPLPEVLEQLEGHIKATEEAARRANESAKLAQLAAAESTAAAQNAKEAGEKAAEVARKEAQEAMAKAEEAMVKAVVKRLARWDWIATLIVINLAIVFGAVMLAFALGQGF